LSINEGIAIDARLVQSASKPLSNDELRKLKDKRLQEYASVEKISKRRYIVEQYFGLSHLHDGAYRARFTTIVKNIWDTMCRQMAFNICRGAKLVTS
jgi:hypothetical protein